MRPCVGFFLRNRLIYSLLGAGTPEGFDLGGVGTFGFAVRERERSAFKAFTGGQVGFVFAQPRHKGQP